MARDLPGCAGTGCPCAQTPSTTHDEKLAQQYGGLGDQLCREGEFRDARHMYERQLEALERLHGKDSLELVPALLCVADACRSYDRGPTAAQFVARALALLEKHLWLKSEDPASALEGYERWLSGGGQHHLAAQMAARARALRCRRDS
jgi:hypothetical protein